jgi:prevent-host-death family protein
MYNSHERPRPVRTYPLHEARAAFSKLIERALKGEPQRVTRYGKEAVVIVSEAAWEKRPKSAGTVADLFLAHAGEEGYEDVLGREPIATQSRPLGSDFLDDEDA